ncbi:MAG: hypothetical protein LBQ34_04475 [Alphaproteobacteria bacterium]|jgi:Sec-independent protein translocase protein TatA|nr:hypothetical protein [Alphaproteobacteria bacterium]
MFGISWFEFLVILIVSFICLKPKDFAKIIRTIRDIIKFINSLMNETKDKLDQSLTLEEFKIEEFYIIDKKTDQAQIAQEDGDNIKIKP